MSAGSLRTGGCGLSDLRGDLLPGILAEPNLMLNAEKMGVLQNGWFMRDYPIKMDDLRVPSF